MLAETEKYQNIKTICDKKKSLKKSKPSRLEERKKNANRQKKTPQKIVRCADEMKILLTAHTQIHKTQNPRFCIHCLFPFSLSMHHSCYSAALERQANTRK